MDHLNSSRLFSTNTFFPQFVSMWCEYLFSTDMKCLYMLLMFVIITTPRNKMVMLFRHVKHVTMISKERRLSNSSPLASDSGHIVVCYMQFNFNICVKPLGTLMTKHIFPQRTVNFIIWVHVWYLSRVHIFICSLQTTVIWSPYSPKDNDETRTSLQISGILHDKTTIVYRLYH